MARAALLPRPPGDVAALTARLRAADIGYVAVDRYLGDSAVASVFLGHDLGSQRQLLLKLVDSDLAYDVGGAEFVRGIGSAQELAEPHVLGPGPDSRRPAGICYVGPFTPAVPLRDSLARSQPVRFADAVRIAMEMAGALDHWHALGLAHGALDWESLLVQGGQVLLSPPERVGEGREARRGDLQALARICLELLDPSAERPERSRHWQRLRAVLARAAAGDCPPSLSARRLADRLTDVEYRMTRPRSRRLASFRRLLASLVGGAGGKAGLAP